jgi:hypothetical protein
MPMKSFRVYLGAGKEVTGVGCLLALLSAAVTVAVGIPLSFWLGRRIGVVFFGLAALVGALFFGIMATVLTAFGIPVWRDERSDEWP